MSEDNHRIWGAGVGKLLTVDMSNCNCTIVARTVELEGMKLCLTWSLFLLSWRACLASAIQNQPQGLRVWKHIASRALFSFQIRYTTAGHVSAIALYLVSIEQHYHIEIWLTACKDSSGFRVSVFDPSPNKPVTHVPALMTAKYDIMDVYVHGRAASSVTLTR